MKYFQKTLSLFKIIPKPIQSMILNNDAFRDDKTIISIKNYINEKNNNNETALMFVQKNENTEIANFLTELLELLKEGKLQQIITLLHSK